MKRKIENIFLGRYNLSENLSGPEKVAKRIFTQYIKENRSVFIEYFFDGNKFSYFNKFFGKKVVFTDSNSKVIRLGILRIFFYLLKENPSIIHIITYERFCVISFIYKIFKKVKIIYSIHGVVYYENLNFKKVSKLYILKDKICEKIFLKYSDRIFFLSEQSKKIASKYFKIDNTKVKIFPNGIDDIFYLKGKGKKIDSSDKLKIVFIGDVNRIEKGFDFIAECLKEVNFSYDFYIISKNNITKYDNENFYFFGNMNTEHYAKFLEDKDIFVSGSFYEPFSIAAVECMASGLVPMVTEETGMSRYIRYSDNGFVFHINDKNGFTNILELLNADRKLLSKISERARSIYDELNWNKIFEMYKKNYIS